jgi:nucleoid DNA-binding protein
MRSFSAGQSTFKKVFLADAFLFLTVSWRPFFPSKESRLTLPQRTVIPVFSRKPVPNNQTNNPMTKRDLVMRISEETGFPQQNVLNVIQKTLDYISEAVTRGEKVELRNFGVFEVKVRKARVGRNPNAPAADVPIPPRSVVKFKPGKEMREAVLLLPPEQIEAIAEQTEKEEDLEVEQEKIAQTHV